MALSYSISGSGFANAKMIGRGAIVASIGAVRTPAADKPMNTSAPRKASSSVRRAVWRANRSLYGFMPSARPS